MLEILDLVVLAGQALSVIGLACGWYAAITYDEATDRRARRSTPVLLHHLAMA